MARFSITFAVLLATSVTCIVRKTTQSSCSETRSHKKMLNKRGPKIEPCGTPDLRSVRRAPKALLLYTAFFHLSIIRRRQCCALKPFRKPHWNFENISLK